MGHPLHGTRPQSDKIGRRRNWGTASGLFFYKLERTVKNRRMVNTDVGRFVALATLDEDGRPQPGPEAIRIASQHPGWELCFA